MSAVVLQFDLLSSYCILKLENGVARQGQALRPLKVWLKAGCCFHQAGGSGVRRLVVLGQFAGHTENDDGIGAWVVVGR